MSNYLKTGREFVFLFKGEQQLTASEAHESNR